MKKENLHKGQQDLIDAVLDEARLTKVKFIPNLPVVYQYFSHHQVMMHTKQDTILVSANQTTDSQAGIDGMNLLTVLKTKIPPTLYRQIPQIRTNHHLVPRQRTGRAIRQSRVQQQKPSVQIYFPNVVQVDPWTVRTALVHGQDQDLKEAAV